MFDECLSFFNECSWLGKVIIFDHVRYIKRIEIQRAVVLLELIIFVIKNNQGNFQAAQLSKLITLSDQVPAPFAFNVASFFIVVDSLKLLLHHLLSYLRLIISKWK